MVTAADIKTLRERTGVGMSKCKKALEEAGGDIELAIANLRKSGMASAVKKEGRATSEGAIAFCENGSTLALIQLSAETDFVVNNEGFQKFLSQLAKQAAEQKPSSIEQLSESPFSEDTSLTVEQQKAVVMQSLGENIQISRITILEKGENEHFGIYSHMGGKIVSVVTLQSAAPADAISTLASDLAMQVAASSPEFVRPEEIPAERIESEKEIARSQMKGKPENMLEKIIEGKLNAYYKECCLIHQPFFKETKKSITDILSEQAKATGSAIEVKAMLRWSVKA